MVTQLSGREERAIDTSHVLPRLSALVCGPSLLLGVSLQACRAPSPLQSVVCPSQDLGCCSGAEEKGPDTPAWGFRGIPDPPRLVSSKDSKHLLCPKYKPRIQVILASKRNIPSPCGINRFAERQVEKLQYIVISRSLLWVNTACCESLEK